MRWVLTIVLLLLALIHCLPVAGVLGAARLEALYGVPVRDPSLAVLLRHRAVMFGLLATVMATAAFHPPLHRLALALGWVSVVSFLVIIALDGPVNAALVTVARVDGVALLLLVVGTAVHLARPHPA